MSMLKLDRHDVDEVIEVLTHAVESVTGCQLVHVTFRRHQKWTTWPPGHPTTSSLRPGERAFIENHGDHWTCTTAVAELSGSPGQLVLRHATKPDAEQMFVIARLGHLLGAALVDAELHERDRRRALELDAANTEMARSVAALNHREAVHEEFTRLAATGTELDVATSLSRLIESTVVLHDRFAHETTRITAAGESPPGRRASLARSGDRRNRLSRDLLDDLLEGIPADVAADRASAQGHDLGVPHDLILCAWSSDTGPGVTTGTSIISGRPWLISGCPAWMRQGRSLRPPRREQRLSLTERASNWVHSCTRTSGGRLTWARPTTATSTSEHQGSDSMTVARVGAPRGRARRDCGALRRGR